MSCSKSKQFSVFVAIQDVVLAQFGVIGSYRSAKAHIQRIGRVIVAHVHVVDVFYHNLSK